MKLINATNISISGALAHSFLVLSYYLTKNDLKDFSLGHIFVTLAFSEKVKKENMGSLKTTLLGTIGHVSLLTTFIIQILLKSKLSLKKVLYVIGQIGMILFYWMQYYYKDKLFPVEASSALLLPFIFLAYFYIVECHKAFGKNNFISLAKFFLIIVYFLLFYKQLMTIQKTDPDKNSEKEENDK